METLSLPLRGKSLTKAGYNYHITLVSCELLNLHHQDEAITLIDAKPELLKFVKVPVMTANHFLSYGFYEIPSH